MSTKPLVVPLAGTLLAFSACSWSKPRPDEVNYVRGTVTRHDNGAIRKGP